MAIFGLRLHKIPFSKLIYPLLFKVNIDSSGRRAGSADAGVPPAYLATNKPNLWIPDYNVKFITDGVYLKIR